MRLEKLPLVALLGHTRHYFASIWPPAEPLKLLDKHHHKLSCKIFPKICKIRLVKFKNLRYNEFSLSKLRGVTSAKSKISVGGVTSQLGSSGAAVYTKRSRLP